MAMRRPLRFGVVVTQGGSAAEWRDKARRVESLGYATLLLPDHLGGQLAFGPALAAAAAATTTLRVGTFVLANDFRHPALVAMEAATLDLLSDGRLELGLGAGGSAPADYARAGIPFNPPGVRVERLAESVRIIKALLADGAASFQGQHYRLDGLTDIPRPRQRPHPPILLGGGGRRMLALAGREADIISVIPRLRPGGGLDPTDATAAAVEQKIHWLRAAAGARFDALELNTLVQAVVVTADRRAAAEQLGARFQLPAEALLESPYVLLGTTEELVEQVLAWRERFGLSYVVIFEPSLEALAPVVARLAGR